MTVTRIFTLDEETTFDLEHGLPTKTSSAMREVLKIGIIFKLIKIRYLFKSVFINYIL
jgi:hypothetical protein